MSVLETVLLLIGLALAAVFCLVLMVGAVVLDRRVKDIEKEWKRHDEYDV